MAGKERNSSNESNRSDVAWFTGKGGRVEENRTLVSERTGCKEKGCVSHLNKKNIEKM